MPFANHDSAIELIADDRPMQDDEVSDREELAKSLRAISAFPAAIREPLVLRTIEGLSQSETAEILGITEKAVETRLRRARERLRVAMHYV